LPIRADQLAGRPLLDVEALAAFRPLSPHAPRAAGRELEPAALACVYSENRLVRRSPEF
jgi:hypothetical protein